MVSDEEVIKIAGLARLEIEADFVPVVTGHFNSILEYFAGLSKIDTTNVEPMSHTNSSTNVLRDDVLLMPGSTDEPSPLSDSKIPVQEMLKTEDVMKNAPDKSGTYIRVPIIVE